MVFRLAILLTGVDLECKPAEHWNPTFASTNFVAQHLVLVYLPQIMNIYCRCESTRGLRLHEREWGGHLFAARPVQWLATRMCCTLPLTCPSDLRKKYLMITTTNRVKLPNSGKVGNRNHFNYTRRGLYSLTFDVVIQVRKLESGMQLWALHQYHFDILVVLQQREFQFV